MANRTCSIDDCGRPHRARGYCSTHYLRWQKSGTPQADTPVKEYGAPKPPCPVADCDQPVRAGGMCSRHYQNTKNYGSAIPLKERPIAERLERVGWDVTDGDCWEWRGRTNEWGYGMYNHRRVHRLMYEQHVGPIPDGLFMRHRCDNPPCVNPDHLEPGTHQQNMDDMVSRGRSKDANRTHCANGHDLRTPGAVKVDRRSGATYNACVECARARSLRYAHKNRRDR